MHVGSHCSPNRDRKVITRCRIGINKVVKNVNSPDEDELAINDRQLAMETANSCSKESKVQEAGAVDAYLNARFSERGKPAFWIFIRSEPINHQVSGDTALRRLLQRSGYRVADDVILKNVGFQKDFMLGLRYGID